MSDAMLALARAARDNAYARYSNFPVGACLLTESGRLFAGANVENAAFPQGQCAEASAIGAMVTAGDRRIRAVVVVAAGPELCTPCGGCRQRLAEFGDRDTPVHLATAEGGVQKTVTLGELLPMAFGPINLERGPVDD